MLKKAQERARRLTIREIDYVVSRMLDGLNLEDSLLELERPMKLSDLSPEGKSLIQDRYQDELDALEDSN